MNNNGKASSSSSSSLTLGTAGVVVAAWSSVAVTTFLVRQWKKRKIRLREEQVTKQGGLLPDARNILEALQIRATTTITGSNRLALEGANGTKYTWKEYHTQVRAFALALRNHIKIPNSQGCGIAIHAFNRPEWFFSALGAMANGGTVSGIYLTNTYEQAKHILATSQVKVLVLEGIGLLETTYKTVLQDFPQLTVVLLDDFADDDSSSSSRTISYHAFVKDHLAPSSSTSSQQQQVVQLPLVPLKKDHVACLVYTSGTTGNPKAVELTHENIRSVVATMHARIPLKESSVFVSYLPLSHIAAMGIDMFSPIFCGGAVHFADADALRGTLKDTLLRVRPTLFFGVPRVWEKMAAAFQTAAQTSYEKPVTGTILKSMGTVAKMVGAAWYNYNTTPEILRCTILALPFGFFKKVAFSKVRRKCGLDRAELLYTGAAPLATETFLYLQSLDMPLLEVFGMSESCGVIAVCGPNDTIRPMGACGKVLPMGELLTTPDDEGEVTYKGHNVMRSYKGLPKETDKTVDPKTRVLHTGDLGTIDKYGYLYITGRKKDLLITSGGENVSPAPIEETLKALLNSNNDNGGRVGHVLLVGDRRKYLTILVAPKEEDNNNLAVQSSPIAPDDIEQAIATYNTSYAKSRAQRVQKAHVVLDPFTVATGELTPTLKVKRNVVVAKYTKEIDSMYDSSVTKNALVGYSSMNIDQPE